MTEMTFPQIFVDKMTELKRSVELYRLTGMWLLTLCFFSVPLEVLSEGFASSWENHQFARRSVDEV